MINESNIKEFLIDNFKCIQLPIGNRIDYSLNKKKVVISYVDLTLEDYVNREVFNLYPSILIKEKSTFTTYNKEIESFILSPTFENADDESLYINLENDEVISVIIDASIVKDYNNDISMNNCKKIKSKTYIMIDGNGYYKIGKSYNPVARESTLQSENPTIELIAFSESDIEEILHKEYKDFRKRGEWFKLDKEQVNIIVKKFNFKTLKSY